VTEGPRVALVVDNPPRDLAGLILVSLELCRRGMSCFLVPMLRQRAELRALAPDVVILNYLRPGNDDLVDALAEAEVATIVVDTEGGIFPNVEFFASTLPRDAGVRRRVSAFCTWGPRMADYLVRENWFSEEQVVVTGTPRFDYYAPQWQSACLRGSPPPFARPDRPLVLLNGNFPMVNPRFQSPEAEARMLVERFGHAPETVAGWQRTQQATLEGIVGLTNALGARFADLNFGYRPHPFERIETYHSLLAARPNIALLEMGSVDEWIVRASAVIQRSCTTAVEAGLAGVPALSPRWLPVAREMPSAEAVSIGCATEETLFRTIEQAVAGRLEPDATATEALSKVIADWFFRIDGNAHQRVADTVSRVTTFHDPSAHARRCGRVAIGGNRIKAAARTYLPPGLWSQLARRSRGARNDKHLAAEDVIRIADGIQRVSGGAVDIERATRADYRLTNPHPRSIAIRGATQ